MVSREYVCRNDIIVSWDNIMVSGNYACRNDIIVSWEDIMVVREYVFKERCNRLMGRYNGLKGICLVS